MTDLQIHKNEDGSFKCLGEEGCRPSNLISGWKPRPGVCHVYVTAELRRGRFWAGIPITCSSFEQIKPELLEEMILRQATRYFDTIENPDG